ncbi:c-type cytochrome [Sulfurimonas sp.]|uniref:c-type cytochrome n=1 Tax=Sulfurimonas sp. TaxID=2022749 RepID=UPI0025E7743D|nr:c-type cytochrome [Sulfurimonas sp.]MCK9474053.1 c-type cytochrome [Sulfurimonas sp.]
MKLILSMAVALFFLGCSSENKQEAKETLSETKAKATQSVTEAKEAVSEKAVEVKEVVSEKAAEVKEAVSEKVAEVKEAITAPKIDAQKMYQVCAGCHGADGSKAALGKSQIIKGWDAKKTADALTGYKAGTYGGAMKGLMTGQVSKLSNEEIEALSEYISTL